MKTKKVRNYYEEIDKALYSHEYCKPWHDKPMEWITNRIYWCWKFRHITREQMEELADRACAVFEQEIAYNRRK